MEKIRAVVRKRMGVKMKVSGARALRA